MTQLIRKLFFIVKKTRRVTVDLEKLAGAMQRRIGEYSLLHNIHRNTVSNKLHGRVRLTFEDLNEFAEFLERDSSEFLKLEGQVLKDIRRAA